MSGGSVRLALPGPCNADEVTTKQPARTRVTLTGISSRAWEHPADRGALVALRRLKGFDSVLKAVSGLFNERAVRLVFLGSAIRVDERQFARLHRLLGEVARTLDAPELPELFVTANPVPSAMTIGMKKPFVVVTSGMVDLLDDEELRFVLGHELGHAMSGHAVYQSLLQQLIQLSGVLNAIPAGGLSIRAIMAALYEWSRKAELSADRAGLLATQDPATAFRVHMKLASGGHLDDLDATSFFAQGQEYDDAGDLRDSVLKLLLTENRTHPFAVVRRAAPLGRLGGLHPLPGRHLPAPRRRRRRDGERGGPGGGRQLHRDVPTQPGRGREAGARRGGPPRLGQAVARRGAPSRRGLSPGTQRPPGPDGPGGRDVSLQVSRTCVGCHRSERSSESGPQ